MFSQALYSAEQIFTQTKTSLENTINRYDVLTFSLSTLNELTKKYDDEPLTANQMVAARNALEKSMYSLASDTENSGIKVYGPGDVFGFYNGQTYLTFQEAENQSWFQDLMDGFQESFSSFILCPVESIPENDPANAIPGKRFERVLGFARIIKNPENYHECIGVVRIDLNEIYVQKILEQNNLYHDYVSYVETKSGELILAGQSFYSGRFSGFLPETCDTNGSWVPVNVQGSRYLLRKEPIGKYNAVLVNIIPEEEIFAQLSSVRQTAVLVACAAVLFSLILAFFLAGSIGKRTQYLAGIMRSVKTGNLRKAEEKMGQDEIGVLASSYNYMVDEMHQLMKSAYQNGQRLKNAELRLLQAQINPHFLYNTLDMISFFNERNQTEEVQGAISALVRFYRITLSKGKDFVTLREELQHVYYYVFLENMRYGGRIHLQLSVPQELQSYTILKTTLQPIVENAILHGIMCKPEKKRTHYYFSQRARRGYSHHSGG